jgi:hypothetical protein
MRFRGHSALWWVVVVGLFVYLGFGLVMCSYAMLRYG